MRVRTQGSIGVSPAGAMVIDKTDRIAYISVDLADKWPYILHYSRAGFDDTGDEWRYADNWDD